MWPSTHETADLVTLTEEFRNGQLHFLWNGVCVNSRHKAREAEPKDHDVHCRDVQYNSKNRNLHQSTYDRILDVTDGVSTLLEVVALVICLNTKQISDKICHKRIYCATS